MPPPPRPLRYEPAMDGLRAIAVCSVVVFHTSKALPGGWVGVDLFFVLSGYLITRLLWAERAQSGSIDIRRFYIRRFLRLTPAFACLIAFILVRAALSHDYQAPLLRSALVSAAYLMNWDMAFHPAAQDILLHTWSLAAEEQFYLVWPAILLAVFGRRPVPVILAVIAAVIAWRVHIVLAGAPFERTYFGFDTHADSLLIGCALALVPRPFWVRRLAGATVLVPLLGLGLMALTLDIGSAQAQTFGITLAALSTAWIVVALDGPSVLKSALSIRPLVYTGKLSYALYLWHYPVYWILRRHLPDVLPAGVPTLIALASVPISMASYHWVEKPCLRLKARFEPSREGMARPFDGLAAGPPLVHSSRPPL